MRTMETLRRVVNDLKKIDINIKEISAAVGTNHNYLTRIISGNTKYSKAVYDKIMELAREHDIDTTPAGQSLQIPMPQHEHGAAEGLTGVINLKVKITNNKISGVEWDLVD